MNLSPISGRGNRRKPMAEINVVPYIDVSLVLLIIFMVTTPLLQTGVDVNLTKVEAESKSADPNKEPPVRVYIKEQGQMSVDVGDQKNVAVDKDGLSEIVLAALKGKPGREVWVGGDESVPYGKVLTMMAVLKKAGVPKVSLMTAPAK